MVAIDRADDPRLAPFAQIRERDLVRQGDFIAEGVVVIDHLLRAREFAPVAFLVSRHRQEGFARRYVGIAMSAPVYVVEQPVMDTIAGFHVHRGILAQGRRSGAVRGAGTLPDRGTVVVACGLSNHDNMGVIFRNAAAFGVRAIILDAQCCDPLYRKSLRVSVGTVLTVPFWRGGSAEEIVRDLLAADYACMALTPAAEQRLDRWAAPARCALFFGSEGEGLPESVLSQCQGLSIAMSGGLDSLNVAAAAAIALHHVFTTERSAAPDEG